MGIDATVWSRPAVRTARAALSRRGLFALAVLTMVVCFPGTDARAGRGSCKGHSADPVGSSHDDTLTGGPGGDAIVGLGGDDKIDGLGGKDFLCGNGGNDNMDGGPGEDYLKGGDGNDRLDIDDNDGGDKAIGGGGHDTCYADTGDSVTQCETVHIRGGS